MKLKSYAKINLFLDILNKREDGYHNILSFMQEISLFDIINIEKNNKNIEVSCNVKEIPQNKGNIAYKAADKFFKYTKINSGIKINIEKNIPFGAGLGGGSSNAATVLIALNKIYETNLSNEKLCEIGKEIGADVPFFIIGNSCIAEGIGEKLTEFNWNFKPIDILIIKPDVFVSTKKVYEALEPKHFSKLHGLNELKKALIENNVNIIGKKLENILEKVTIQMHSEIEDIKKVLLKNNALGSLMSGSGSAVFGVFENTKIAVKAFENITKNNKLKCFLCNFHKRKREVN